MDSSSTKQHRTASQDGSAVGALALAGGSLASMTLPQSQRESTDQSFALSGFAVSQQRFMGGVEVASDSTV